MEIRENFKMCMKFIPGLDPAKPLVENHASVAFRLTRDDAAHVQIIHTNAGFLGQSMLTGSVDFCINGGRDQPYCKGNAVRKLFHCLLRVQ